MKSFQFRRAVRRLHLPAVSSLLLRLEPRITPANNAAAAKLIADIEIANAGGNNTIIAESCLFTDIYPGQNGQNVLPQIVAPMTITIQNFDVANAFSDLRITNGIGRFFEVMSSGSLELKGLRIQGGDAVLGGAIRVNGGGELTIRECTLATNSADDRGGAIFSQGSIHIFRSTLGGFSGEENSAVNQGSAVWSDSTADFENVTINGNRGSLSALYLDGPSQVFYCTITGNTGVGINGSLPTVNNPSGVALHNVDVMNSIFENNGLSMNPNAMKTVDFSFLNSNGVNTTPLTNGPTIFLNGNIYQNAQNPVSSGLGGLALNGGRTFCRSPLNKDAEVIDVGSATLGISVFSQADATTIERHGTDQRNGLRVVDGNEDGDRISDMGAVEFQEPSNPNSETSPYVEIVDNAEVFNPGQIVTYTIYIKNPTPFPVNFGRVDITFNHRINPIIGEIRDPNWDENFASRELTEVTWWTMLEDNSKGRKSGTGAIHEVISMQANGTLVYHVTVNIPTKRSATVLDRTTGQLVTKDWLLGQNTDIGDKIIARVTLGSFPVLSGTPTGSIHWRDENILQPINANPAQIQAPVPWTNTNQIRTVTLRYQDKVGTDPSLQYLLAHPVVAVGSDSGKGSDVLAMDAITGDVRFRWFPFGDFAGGVHVTTGDVVGHYVTDLAGNIQVDAQGFPVHDGTVDVIVAAAAGGGSHIKIYDGRTGFLFREFFAYDPNFKGGSWVAAGDVDGAGLVSFLADAKLASDQKLYVSAAIVGTNGGRDEVITGAGAGGTPHVRAFSIPPTFASRPTLVRDFYAYSGYFRGGVTVASADVDGDGRADIVTGAGPGGGPHVRIFSGVNNSLLSEFYAYQAKYQGGVFVAAGDLDNLLDSGFPARKHAEVITAPMSNGGPHVRVFSPYTPTNPLPTPLQFSMGVVGEFFAADYFFMGGVRVGVADRNNDGILDIVTSTGKGTQSRVKTFSKNGTAITYPAINQYGMPTPAPFPGISTVPFLIPFTNIDTNGGFVG